MTATSRPTHFPFGFEGPFHAMPSQGMARYGRAPCDFFLFSMVDSYDTDVIRRYIIPDLEGLVIIGGNNTFFWWLRFLLTGFVTWDETSFL
jgi:hypothetical protein